MTNKLSPIQSIKQFCRSCNGEATGGHHYDCLDHNCVLYPFKEGKGNYEADAERYVTKEHKDYLDKHGKGVQKSKQLSPEAKQKFSDRMKKAWETRKKQQSNSNEEDNG